MPKNSKSVTAAKYSTCNASTMPCADAWVNSLSPQGSASWRRISHFNLPKTFSLTPEYYAITIYGEAYNYTASQVREVEIQKVYRTYHPSIAVGRAVIDFFKNNSRATITSINILKRYEKP